MCSSDLGWIEVDEIKGQIICSLNQSSDPTKRFSNKNKIEKATKRMDGVKYAGICSYSGGRLRPVNAKNGDSYTVCENFTNGLLICSV